MRTYEPDCEELAPNTKTVVGTLLMNQLPIIMNRTYRKICLFFNTRCSLEYKTIDCPVTISCQPISMRAIDSISILMTLKNLKSSPRVYGIIPIVASRRLQKYRPPYRLKETKMR